MPQVAFKTSTQSQYDALSSKNEDTLYFITDTKVIYKGSHRYSCNFVIVTELPATGIEKTFYFNSTNSILYYYDGTHFVTVSNYQDLSAYSTTIQVQQMINAAIASIVDANNVEY